MRGRQAEIVAGKGSANAVPLGPALFSQRCKHAPVPRPHGGGMARVHFARIRTVFLQTDAHTSSLTRNRAKALLGRATELWRSRAGCLLWNTLTSRRGFGAPLFCGGFFFSRLRRIPGRPTMPSLQGNLFERVPTCHGSDHVCCKCAASGARLSFVSKTVLKSDGDHSLDRGDPQPG
jgi:hypothetical protein